MKPLPQKHQMFALLRKLEGAKIFFRLSRIDPESVLIEVVVPGERWEIQVLEEGGVQIEKFLSNGEMYSEDVLDDLFARFSEMEILEK